MVRAHLDTPPGRETASAGLRPAAATPPTEPSEQSNASIALNALRLAEPRSGSAGLRPAARRGGTCVFEPAVTSTSGQRAAAHRAAFRGARVCDPQRAAGEHACLSLR